MNACTCANACYTLQSPCPRTLTSSILPSYAARCNGTFVSMVSFVGSKLGSSHLLGPPAKGDGASFIATPCEHHLARTHQRAHTHAHTHTTSRVSDRRRRALRIVHANGQLKRAGAETGLRAGAGTGRMAGVANVLHLLTPACDAPVRMAFHTRAVKQGGA